MRILWKKYYLLPALLLSAVLALFFTSKTVSVSAISLGDSYGTIVPTSASHLDYANTTIPATIADNQALFTGLPMNTWFTHLNITLEETVPANSLFSFTVYYRMVSLGSYVTPNIQYAGLTPRAAWNKLSETCFAPEGMPTSYATGTPQQYSSDFSCTIVAISNVDLKIVITEEDTLFLNFRTTASDSSGLVMVSPVNYRTLNNNALTDDDRTWLQSVMPAGSSTADIESAAEAALDSQTEAEREELQTAQSEAEDDAQSSADNAEDTGTTLLKAFTDFVAAVKNTDATNCNIDMDMGNLDLGVVNLCQLSPPPAFQSLASIVLIGFCVPLSLATGRKVIALFRSFQT